MSCGGGGTTNRIKKGSTYEPSDDESILEFQTIENQLLSSKGSKITQQDIQPGSYKSSTFKKNSIAKKPGDAKKDHNKSKQKKKPKQ